MEYSNLTWICKSWRDASANCISTPSSKTTHPNLTSASVNSKYLNPGIWTEGKSSSKDS